MAISRPTPLVERLAQDLYLLLAPRLPRSEPRDPPARLAPFERMSVERSAAEGELAATFYAVEGTTPARGLVVLAHPWHAHGQGYFHRRHRIPALRAAGYQVLTFDFGGFGRSGPRPRGFLDRDIDDVLDAAERLMPDGPIHFWGVSAGGYWAHPVLARRSGVGAAVFEDVAAHLIGWSKRLAPMGWPFYLVFQHLLKPAYRFLDLKRHVPGLKVSAVAYIGGAEDRGALPTETRELARLAGGECHIVPGADHLEAIRCDADGVIELALATLARAERQPRSAEASGITAG